MTSVNEPPYAYNPDGKPRKSILKSRASLSRAPSSWLSTINSKFSSFAPEEQANQQQQQQQQQPRPLGLFRKFINTHANLPTSAGSSSSPADTSSAAALSTSTATASSSSGATPLPAGQKDTDNDELAPNELKRVRFPIGKLTTEYYPYRRRSRSSSTASQPDNPKDDAAEDDDDDEKSGDAPVLSDAATAALIHPPEKKTPRELFEVYEMACRTREEPMIGGLVANLNAHQHMSTLTKLDLSKQNLTRRAMEPIADVLMCDFNLQQLIMQNSFVEDDGLKILLHALLLNDTVRLLDLTDNKNIKASGFKYLAIYAKESTALEHLNLSGTAPDKKGIQYLAQALHVPPSATKIPSLRKLTLDRCMLKQPLLEVLAGGVRKSRSLRDLSLRCNKINAQGALWLGVLLRDYDDHLNHGLERLYLDSNDIRQGVLYLAQALRRNKNLATLSLRDCKLDSKAAALVGEAMKYNQSLVKLDISINPLNQPTNEGVLALKQALYINRSLQELNLAATGLGPEAAIAMAECLPENQSLLRLDLSRNTDIDLAGLMALSASMRINQTLTFLDVNIPQNDRDMAKVQSDIMAACTHNAQASATPPRGADMRRTGSQSSMDPNTVVSTTQATARLTLQERLAAVTGGKSTASSIRSSNASIDSVRIHEPEPQPKPKRVLVDPETVDVATGQVLLFEEMLSAETESRDDVVDSEQGPDDALKQVYRQCRKSQNAISSFIHQVTDADQLGLLLNLNDRLTESLALYKQLFPPAPAKTTTPTLSEQTARPDALSPTLGENEPPSTSFEIGDVDEDEDDLIPPRHPSPGLEERRKEKDMEEGAVFAKQQSAASEPPADDTKQQ